MSAQTSAVVIHPPGHEATRSAVAEGALQRGSVSPGCPERIGPSGATTSPASRRGASPERGLSVIDRGLRSLLSRRFGAAPLRFSLADGTDIFDSGPDRVATVVFQDRRTLLSLLVDPDRNFGDAYAEARIDVQGGELVAALEAAYRALDRSGGDAPPRAVRRGHSLRESRDNVHRHYDLGNDFYHLWLDDQMIYTCAYFPHGGMSLEQAQVAKLDRVCRKLRLRPGEKVVEAGCGWGALALHMARRCGVSVRAYNVSTEQIRYARERADAEGLSGLVEFVQDDYRGIAGRYDVFVSLGMLEHVGPGDYGRLGSVIRGCLDPAAGRGLLHFIGRDRPQAINTWIGKRIFPGAYPPTLSEVASGVLEPAGLSTLDVENLRPHYAATLAHWRARFEAAAENVASRYGSEFTRGWRLYLAGSEAAFRTGSLQLFQIVFGRDGTSVPWGRVGLES